MLTAAKEDFLGLGGFKLYRSEICSVVRSVAEGLVCGLSAGAPEIQFSFLYIDRIGGFLGNGRVWHGVLRKRG